MYVLNQYFQYVREGYCVSFNKCTVYWSDFWDFLNRLQIILCKWFVTGIKPWAPNSSDFKIKYIQIRLNERSLPSCSQFSIPFIFRKSFQIYESLLVGEGRTQARIWLTRLYLLWFWADYRKWNENRVASKRHLLDLYLKKSSKIKFWEGLNEWIKLAIVLKVFFFLNRWFPTGNSHFIWFSTLESLRSVFSCNGAHAVS